MLILQFFGGVDSKSWSRNRWTKSLLLDAFIYPHFVFKFHRFTFRLFELMCTQSRELYILVAYCDANRRVTTKVLKTRARRGVPIVSSIEHHRYTNKEYQL